MEQGSGTLYLCATPIGNLKDITLRVVEALERADQVWAEDTRRTLRLLNHLHIKKPLVSCHEHNERLRAEELIALLANGKCVAYASDAGMPCVSDPGAKLVEACIEAGAHFEVLPGASAVLTAAVYAGFPMDRFTFFGFLPRENPARRDTLSAIAHTEHLSLLYESPQRLGATLQALCDVLGPERRAAVLRELTKLHEEAIRGTLASLCEHFSTPPKGECVIAVMGQTNQAAVVDDAAVDDLLLGALQAGASVRDAAALAVQSLHIPKKRAYQRALALKDD